MAKSASHPLKVFIGCPGDMALERDLLLSLEKKLAKRGCPVEFLVWPDVPPAAGRPQQVIFDHFPVETWDIFVGLLWNRFGSSAGEKDDRTGKPMTGTEEEFKRAYEAWKESGRKRPHIAVYRCERPEKTKGKGAQIAAVDAFFDQLAAEKDYPALTFSFTDPHVFKDSVEEHLVEIIGKIRAEQAKSKTVNKKQKEKSPKPAAPAPDSAVQLHRYFNNLRDQFSHYENLGLPIPDRDAQAGEVDAPLAIRKLFVAPTCSEAHYSPEAFDAALREGKKPANPLLPHLAPAKSRTVLLADPGMGKSTLIQWLIATLADEAVPLEQAELRGAVPLPFILRDLVAYLPKDVKDWNWTALVDAFRHWRPRDKVAPLAAPLTADEALFRATLASPHAFFLIDGLDEIGDPQRRLAIRDALWEGFEKYPEARWLVTSRIVGYEQASVQEREIEKGDLDSSFEELRSFARKQNISIVLRPSADQKRARVFQAFATLLYLAPFDDSQQLTFAQNWYRPRLGEVKGTQHAGDFIAAVHRHPHTRVISRVPNLLYLLALLYRHRARLPDGRALVYAAISSAYLADIDLSRHLPDSLVVAWKTEEKEDLLALIALRMQELRAAKREDDKGDILVTRAQLEEWLGPRFGGQGDKAVCEQLTDFLDHIATRSGLLLPRGEGVFGFAHLSFQEYYAACHLKKDFERIGEAIIAGETLSRSDAEFFARLAEQPVWHEPLLFLVERLRDSPPFTKRLLKWMFPQLDHGDPVEGRKWMPFPAAQLLATLSIDPEVALDDAQREAIWRALWTAHIAAFHLDWNIAPHLVAAGSAFQPAVLRAAAALQPKHFHLIDCTGVSDLQPLAGLVALNTFSLIGCTGVSDLQPLAGLAALNTLTLYGCTGVSDLQPLAGLAALNTLHLDGCTGVSDLQPLAGLADLNTLHLDGCTGVSDLQPLAGLAALNSLWLFRCTGVSHAEVAALKAKLPKLTIFGP